MAVPVARVHLKVAHAALPALLPTPPVWKKMLTPLLPTTPLAPTTAKPSRADADERWDAHKTKPGSSAKSSASSSPPRSAAVSIKNCAGRGSCRKKATSPPPKPGRADSAERWDAHKKQQAASTTSAGSSSSSSKIIKLCPPARQAELPVPDDGESNSTRSNDVDTEEDDEEEEIVWKPRAMYAGPGFAAAVPQPGMLPIPTAFLVPAA